MDGQAVQLAEVMGWPLPTVVFGGDIWKSLTGVYTLVSHQVVQGFEHDILVTVYQARDNADDQAKAAAFRRYQEERRARDEAD